MEEAADLPRTVQAVCHPPFYEGLTLSSDFTKELSAKLSAQVGIKYMAKNVAAFRVGYNSAYDLGSGLSFGVGIRAWDMQIDYAFAVLSTLGAAHHFGLTFRFRSLQSSIMSAA